MAAPPLQQPDAGRALPAAHAQTQLQRHLDQLSTTISKSRSRSREPSAATAAAATGQAHVEDHVEGSGAVRGEGIAAAIASNPHQAQEQAHPDEQEPSPAAVDDNSKQQQQQQPPPEGVQKSTAAASAVASHQRTEASQDSSQDDEAKGGAHDKAVVSCAQSSAATRTLLAPTALTHMRKPAMRLRMTELVPHPRQSRLLGQEGLHAGGKHLDGSPPQPPWLAEGRGQQAGRAQAGVEAELRLLLLGQLSSHLGGQLLEALLASGVGRHRDRLGRISLARP